MRVRLSYSVEIEEIIEEVQRLMNKSGTDFTMHLAGSTDSDKTFLKTWKL